MDFWSPSTPMSNPSSLTDSEENDPSQVDDALQFMPKHLGRTDEQHSVVLTTFQPKLGTNLFSLSEEEVHSMHSSLAGSNGPTMVLFMHDEDRLALLGTCKLAVIHGSLLLFGIPLSPSSTLHPVFAPQSSPIPVIECVQKRGIGKSSRNILPARLMDAQERFSHAILMQELQCGVEGLGRVCRTFGNVFELPQSLRNQVKGGLGLRGVHIVPTQTTDIWPFVLPRSWEMSMSSVICSNQPHHGLTRPNARKVYLVKGVKKSGKSTFARTLTSRLTRQFHKVAFLECDIGQSEFTPGGMVALNVVSNPIFGPPFTHPSIPYRAHYIGATSPQSSPSHYLEAVHALMSTYNLDIQYSETLECGLADGRVADIVPLVVNMMGWTKGLGSDLSKRIEDIVQPSDIFEFETAATEEHWFPSHTADIESSSLAVDTNHSTKLHSVEPVSSKTSTRYSGADHRNLSILSYFHARFSPILEADTLHSAYASSWDIGSPLCAQTPFLLTPQALDAVVFTGAGSEDVVSCEVLPVLNGAVVALVTCEPETFLIDGHMDLGNVPLISPVPYTQGSVPPSPSTSACHGLALIRSSTISATSALLQLLTPLPPAMLSAAQPRVLVKGELALPVWGMLDFRTDALIAGVDKTKVSFLKWGKGEGLGGGKRRVRKNLQRRGQM